MEISGASVMDAKSITNSITEDEKRELVRRAKGALVNVALRVLEIVARYFQFRMRDVASRGLFFNHSYDIKIEGDEVQLILRVKIPQHLLDEAVEDFTRLYVAATKVIKRRDSDDRKFYDFVDFEEKILGEQEEKKSGG